MKKRYIAFFAALTFGSLFAGRAIPAYPYPIEAVQPDGTKVTVRMHGDEFHHWSTMNGQVVHKAADGFWRPGVTSTVATKAGLSSGPRMTRENAAPKTARAPFVKGEYRFPVILVEFKDLKMRHTRQEFEDMMNKKGFDDRGGTGSARDYYEDNSLGAFSPSFDIIGPVTLSGNYADYGKNNEDGEDENVLTAQGFAEACRKAYDQGLVDFSKYPLAGSELQTIYFFYAGYSEADGGPEDTIWPHAWYFRTAGVSCSPGGITINRYACSSELQNYSGNVMTGIGPFCHEFSHVLGLWDLYDTDYEDNGYCGGMYLWSLMSDGSRLNNMNTPPAYLAVEREMLGWMGKIPSWTEKGEKTLAPVSGNVAFSTPTTNPGEINVYEYRDGKGWDAYVPKGLIIYHKDASENNVHGIKAKVRWENGDGINAYSDHPCCYLNMADNSSYEAVPFPGESQVRTFVAPDDWIGGNTGYSLRNIRYDLKDNITFTMEISLEKELVGTVYDVSGKPIQGASVALRVKEVPTKASRVTRGRMCAAKDDSEYFTETDAEGNFRINMADDVRTDFEIVVSCRGYLPYSENLSLGTGTQNKDVQLKTINYDGLSGKYSLYKFNEKTLERGQYFVFSWNAPQPEYFVSIYYSVAQLKEHVGRKINKISFVSPATDLESVSVLVDESSRSTNLIEREVKNFEPNKWNTVDISDADLRIPAGKPLYFGFHVKGAKEETFASATNDSSFGGFYYTIPGYAWTEGTDGTNDVSALIVVELGSIERTLDSAGINAIAVADSYTAGSTYNFTLLSSASATPTGIVWKYDGEVQQGAGVTLTAGEHLVEAVLTYKDGTVETLEQWIRVQ